MVVLTLCLFVFLFCLYALCRDDFVFLRKNVTLEWLFNAAFLTLGVSLFSSRLIYVLFNFDSIFLNPFVFLLFTHYPGLSLTGGVLGGIAFNLIYLKQKKLPTGHILDSFSISFLLAVLFGVTMAIFSTKFIFKEITMPFLIFEFIIYLLLFIIFFRSFQKTRFKEGSTTLLFLVIFGVLSLLSDILVKKNNILTWRAYEDYLLIIMLLISIFIFVKKEELLKRLKFKRHMKRTLRKFDL